MTTISRRALLRGAARLAASSALASQSAGSVGRLEIVKPPRLRPGDKVGLANPAGAAFETIPTEVQADSIRAFGLEPVVGPNYRKRRGYLAGSDEERAADLNGFLRDPDVRAVWATGGWGSARILPLVDYDALRRDPKVLAGFSDVTALLNGVHARTGLVTFHAPFPRNRRTAERLREVLVEGEAPLFSNEATIQPKDTVIRERRTLTLRPGTARGRLVGGNLTVLSAIVGSPFVPDFDGRILFLEDVREAIYRVDRMLTQLALAGLLAPLAGFVFGHCTRCDSDNRFGSLTLEEVLRDHVEPLGVPAYSGALIGHIEEQIPMPLGVEAEIDATAGTIRLLEAAVT